MTKSEKRAKRNRVAAKILLMVGAFTFAFLLSEVAVRVLGLAYPRYGMVQDGIIVVRPHARHLNISERKNLVTFNSWGCNDEEWELSDDSRRILCLGDSFLESMQVPPEDNFLAICEREMGAPTCLMNAGRSGSGTAYQYVLWDKRFRRRLPHDRIVLFVYLGNDLENNHVGLGKKKGSNSATLDREGNIAIGAIQDNARIKFQRWLRGRSAIVHLALFQWARWQDHFAARDENAAERVRERSHRDRQKYQESMDGTVKLIRKWAAEAAIEGTPLAVVVFGKRDQEYKVDFEQQLLTACQEDSIPFTQIAFQPSEHETVYGFDKSGHGHLNFEGHRAAAKQLSPFLQNLASASVDVAQSVELSAN